jgi:multiple sugar transport system permease protein
MATRRMTLAAREARLAYWMLAPTFAVILLDRAGPGAAQRLDQLQARHPRRPARARPGRQRARPGDAAEAGDELVLRLTMRNGSQRVELRGRRLEKTLPAGLTLVTRRPALHPDGSAVRCAFGTWDAGYRETLELAFTRRRRLLRAGAPDVRAAATDMRARAENVLTSLVFTLDNYRRVLSGPDFWPSLRITLGYTFFSAVGSIALGLFAAMLLNGAFRRPGPAARPVPLPLRRAGHRRRVRLGLLPRPVQRHRERPRPALGPPRRPRELPRPAHVDIQLLGLTFAFPLALGTVVVFSSWNYFPFAFLFILARLQAVPMDMYEAADVDGAGPFQKFWFITLPNLAGVLAVLFLLRFMFLINKFEDIFLLTGGAAGTKNLPVMIYDEAFARADIGAGSAVAMILFVILLGFMFVYYRLAPESER